MVTASNASADSSGSDSEADSPSPADQLATAARVLWATFLLSIVVFTLLPVVGLLLGAAPFDPPDPTPYLALVGLVLVGTVALVAAAIYDV